MQTDIQLTDWANPTAGTLTIPGGPRPHRIAGTPRGTGELMLTNGHLGADIIHVPAGDGFAPHTHPGDHVLIVLAGTGTVTIGSTIHPTHAGQLYLVEGDVPHAVGAVTDHIIMTVGSPHKTIHDGDRTSLIPYDRLGPDGVRCTICDARANIGARLHDFACPHCPCYDCRGMPEPQTV